MFCAIFKLNQSSPSAGPPRAIWIHRNKCTSRSDTRIKELKWAEISATTSMGGIPLNCLTQMQLISGYNLIFAYFQISMILNLLQLHSDLHCDLTALTLAEIIVFL